MKTVRVIGRFLHEDGSPIESVIGFYPYPLWLVKDGKTWATRTVEQTLDDGRFDAELTPDVPYVVITPVGKWNIEPVDTDQPIFLRDLLPSHFQ